MITTYKCPNCGGSLVFTPETGKLTCEYCKDSFTEEDLRSRAVEHEAAVQEGAAVPGAQTATETVANQKEACKNEDMAFFTCPDCGAQIMAAKTEMVSTCYYCHNEVVRSEKTDAVFNPDNIIPFAISKEKAAQAFLDWGQRKKFAPPDFFSKAQIEHLTGVYFPYWISDCKTSGNAVYDAKKVRTWQQGDTEFVETSKYKVSRAGSFFFPGITLKALKKIDNRIAESVQPFRLENTVPYSKVYLLGFQAECRDISKKEVEKQLESDVRQYSESLMRDSVVSYSSVVPISLNVKILSASWKYGLLPVWVLTYKAKKGKIYSFAVNGQTGKICGELPVSKKRLFGAAFGLAVLVFAVVFALLFILEYVVC